MYVFDTNVLVAVFHSRLGASHALMLGVLEGEIAVAVSVALFLEYEDVLKRRALKSGFWAGEDEIDAVLDAFVAKARLISTVRFVLRPMLKDPGDEMVLECAMQAGADAIVTMNVADFSGLTPWPGVDVITPGALLRRLKLESAR
jgi:putative PIN family toxin of toxin-antitoxin system